MSQIDERRGLWTEADLIIKQLMRTELGQPLPTITKLQYLFKRLEVPIDTFLENKELALPEEYFKIKYRIMKSPVQYMEIPSVLRKN